LGNYNFQKKIVMKSLLKLQILLTRKNLNAYLIPKSNFYFSEELMLSEERLKYISNFSGSAGWAIIVSLKNEKSAMFTDGRYKIQVRKEVDNKHFKFFNGGLSEIVSFMNKRKDKIKNIGFDPNLISKTDYDFLKSKLKESKIQLKKVEENLVDAVWNKKPMLKNNKVFKLPVKYAGENSLKKIAKVISTINTYQSYGYILNKPDCLSWLLNVRGSELKYTPVFRALAIIKKNGKILIFSENKIDKTVFKNNKNIQFYEFKFLKNIINNFVSKTFLIDPKATPVRIFRMLKKNKNKIIEINCPISERKTIKNIIEQENSQNTHFIDGIAFLKFWKWFESDKAISNMTEEDLSKKIFYYRSLNNMFKGNSFPTISAIGKNAAIVHYRYSKNKSSKIKKNELYLLDSGGQYITGTTDVTRTLILGTPTIEMKNFYTYVLKGHLAISNLIFPLFTKGRDIDAIARRDLWKVFKDYEHGTGHGVGFFLNVHEGPISISKNNEYPIQPGMIISNEPGYYKNNHFGIRIENLELVKKVPHNNNYLFFETLTMIPYEKKLIRKSLMSEEEIQQINKYHQDVFNKINKIINRNDESLKNFLRKKTSPL